MSRVIERSWAKHPFQENTDPNKRSNCIKCGHLENHVRHQSSNWCSRDTCQHAYEEHDEEGCRVKGCSCQEMLFEDFTGRIQELEGMTEGKERVDGERQEEHGDPVQNLKAVATIWGALIGVRITAHDVAVMMGSFKNVRQMANPEHKDNLVDVEGYAEIARRCVEAGEYVPLGEQRGPTWRSP